MELATSVTRVNAACCTEPIVIVNVLPLIVNVGCLASEGSLLSLLALPVPLMKPPMVWANAPVLGFQVIFPLP